MKKLKSILWAAALASVIVCAAPIVGAQVTNPISTEIDRDDDSGNWGLLGLLGLAGLFGLKRRDHDNRTDRVNTTAGR